MGHYDDCYEHDADQRRKKEREGDMAALKVFRTHMKALYAVQNEFSFARTSEGKAVRQKLFELEALVEFMVQ